MNSDLYLGTQKVTLNHFPKNPDPSKLAILRIRTPSTQVQTLPLEGPRSLGNLISISCSGFLFGALHHQLYLFADPKDFSDFEYQDRFVKTGNTNHQIATCNQKTQVVLRNSIDHRNTAEPNLDVPLEVSK